MPRPRSLEPKEALKIYFDPENAAWLRLVTTNALTGKTSHGELSTVVNTAVREHRNRLLKEAKDVHDRSNGQA